MRLDKALEFPFNNYNNNKIYNFKINKTKRLNKKQIMPKK